jgi:hypothetical protein
MAQPASRRCGDRRPARSRRVIAHGAMSQVSSTSVTPSICMTTRRTVSRTDESLGGTDRLGLSVTPLGVEGPATDP